MSCTRVDSKHLVPESHAATPSAGAADRPLLRSGCRVAAVRRGALLTVAVVVPSADR